jgi:GNAT superfamily N-acetyltransferase
MSALTNDLVLRRVDTESVPSMDRKNLCEFLNLNYSYGPPVSYVGSLGPGLEGAEFYWAVDIKTGMTLACSAIIRQTPYLAKLARTVVAPEVKNQGVGTWISQAMETRGRMLGFKKLTTSILTRNLPMLIIKLRQGWLVEGLHQDHDAPGVHEYTLGKVL